MATSPRGPAAGRNAARGPDRSEWTEASPKQLRALDSYASKVHAKAIANEGRVRATWNPKGAWTGRLTASRPPVQSITKSGGLRAAIVPRPGHRFVVADWRHSQLRIAAGLSRDPALLAALQSGKDPHQHTWRIIGGADDLAAGRAAGKALNLALLLRAGPEGIREALEQAGVEPTALDPATVLVAWRASFPDLFAWQESAQGLEELRSPLGRMVKVPVKKRYLQAVLAGILQGAEADALRIVLARTSEEMADLEAQVVLAIHDEVVWEVPAGRAEEAEGRATALMEQGLSAVCAPCPAEVSVEIRDSWGRSS